VAKRDDDDERREENVEAISNSLGALIGTGVAGPLGGVIGAGLGSKLKRWVRGVWAELSASARRNQTDVLFWAIRFGVTVEELKARINASGRTRLLTGTALDAASRTAWEDKVRTLGRSLAEGLLAEDSATIDTEQMIISAIADIEGPQLAMLELLVARRPARNVAEPVVSEPLDLPADSHWRPADDIWDVAWREWSRAQIAHARPRLAPLAPSLLGTLQRHGLAVQDARTGEAIEKYARAFEDKFGQQIAQQGRGGATRLSGAPRVNNPVALAPEPTWSPTELGEQVYLRFRDAGAGVEGVWTAGPDGVTPPGAERPRQPVSGHRDRLRRAYLSTAASPCTVPIAATTARPSSACRPPPARA
jgi:hypothetical protein